MYARQLLQPGRDKPPPLDELQKFLQEPPDAEIPIVAEALRYVPSNLTKHFRVASGELAFIIGASVRLPLTTGASEMWTAFAEHTVVVSLLLALDNWLDQDLRIGYEGEQRLFAYVEPGASTAYSGPTCVSPAFWYPSESKPHRAACSKIGLGYHLLSLYVPACRLVVERDQADATSLMTVKSQGSSSLRPDGVLRESRGRRLLARWEDKAANVDEAVEDLHKKTAAWSRLYYGE